ncbi:hypothetical protein [Seongchinamella unica]|uniref:hypothetical protein n=1 Tax=Seongchinamella unica TaxID=2547392 RepID=UPI001EEE8185|nr:hypothetical protein [Seongchinamella unica]
MPALNRLRGIANTGAGNLSTTGEALALVCKAAQEYVVDTVSPEHQRGAMLCLRGGIASLPAASDRRIALALSAATAAGLGIPVTVLLGDERQCREFHAAFAFFFAGLNLKPGLVTSDLQKVERSRQYRAEIVCTTLRQAANDYLLDRLLDGSGRDLLARRLEPLLRPASASSRLVHQVPGLLLLEDADQQLIDQAPMPISISGGDGHHWTSSVLMQAFSLSQGMVAEKDYLIYRDSGSLELTEEGRERLRDAVATLPRLWQGERLREELVTEALLARDLLIEGVDFEIEGDRLVLLRGQFEVGRPGLTRERLQFLKLWHLVDDSLDPEMLARTYVQRFIIRYGLVGGVAGYLGSVRSLLWREYGCPVLPVSATRGLGPDDLRLSLVPSQDLREAGVMHRLAQLTAGGDSVLVPIHGRTLYRNLACALQEKFQALEDDGVNPRLRRFRSGDGSLLLIPQPDCYAMLNASVNESVPRFDRILVPEEPDSLRALGHFIEALGRYGKHSLELLLSADDPVLREGAAGRLVRAMVAPSELPSPSDNPLLLRLLWCALRRREALMPRALRDAVMADDHIHRLLAFAGFAR